MKIRILKQEGAHRTGEIVDAIKSPTRAVCLAYDSTGSFWAYTLGTECEIAEECEGAQSYITVPIRDTTQETSARIPIQTLADLFGKDIKKITVEF